MPSNINPNNIDGNYPIAGQDNSSQGFRDNFTNTKNNLTVAKTEITDIQNKAILKSALTGILLDNDMEGAPITNMTAIGMRDQIVDLSTAGGGLDIDFALGHTHILTMSASTTLSMLNFPGDAHSQVTLYITCANVSHTLELTDVDATNYSWLGHIDPITNIITFPATGTYQIKISTNDSVTYYIDSIDVTPNYVTTPIRTTTQEIEDSETISAVDSPAVFFDPGTNSTCTLGVGKEGEIRTFALIGTAVGTMTMTVTNPGWQASSPGYIEFNNSPAPGPGCILQYINGRWFCIGNNSCVIEP